MVGLHLDTSEPDEDWYWPVEISQLTTDFLNKLTAIDNLPDNALLVSLDVTSLYTNIPHNEGIDACRFFLQNALINI